MHASIGKQCLAGPPAPKDPALSGSRPYVIDGGALADAKHDIDDDLALAHRCTGAC